MASASVLDIQSLPSLERFDSQLLDLFRQNYTDGSGAGVHVMDETQAPDDDLALQRLMSLKNTQHKQFDGQQQQHLQQQLQQQHLQQLQQQQVQVPQGLAGGDMSLEAATLAAQQIMNQQQVGGYMDAHPHLPNDVLRGLPPHLMALDDELAAAAAGIAGAGGMSGSKRRNRGSRMDDIIKTEQDGLDCDDRDDGREDSRTSTQSPSKRARSSAAITVDSDYEGGNDAGPSSTAHLTITPDMDEETRARIRREKNRVAARKCRAKKMQFMVELQKTLRELMRKNEEYRLQVITWHKMFSREVRLREAMKRIIAVMWQSGGAPPASTGYTANDVIIGLESGTLDINSLLRSLAVINNAHTLATDPNGTTSPTAAAAALAQPAPLIINTNAAAAAAAGLGNLPPTPRHLNPTTPHPNAAQANLMALQMSNSVGDMNGVQGDRSAGNTPCGTPHVNANGSPTSMGMIPNTLLISQTSHVSTTSAFANGAARLSGITNDGMGAGAGGVTSQGLTDAAGAAGVLGLEGAAGAGLEGTWLWASSGSLAGVPTGPSCITTGMQE